MSVWNICIQMLPFGLCSAPATFQRCMLSIFSDMVERFLEVLMDDFFIFRDSFSECLHHLRLVLAQCREKNLTLNWEKCHFMVQLIIVLGHVISKKGIEVDKAKVDLIAHLLLDQLRISDHSWDMLVFMAIHTKLQQDCSPINQPSRQGCPICFYPRMP